MDIALAKTLYRWSRGDSDKIAQLQTWLDAAVSTIATGNGASLASATANGVSVNLMSGSLTVSGWAATLSQALAYIDNPPVSVIRATIVK